MILLAVLGAMVVCVPLVAIAVAPLETGRPVVVISAPWADADGLIRISGGQSIGLERTPVATLAYAAQDDFFDKLKQNGAWAVLDGRAAARICGETL